MKHSGNYHRRATECVAFAKIARDEEERHQLLMMAETLESIAIKREKKAAEAITTGSMSRPQRTNGENY